jgi:hypothetical protein
MNFRHPILAARFPGSVGDAGFAIEFLAFLFHYADVIQRIFFRRLLAVFIFGMATKLSAQGTAFMYQGRLNDSGAPASAAYDLRFAVYDAVTNGHQISVSLTNAAVPVSNGLFAVTLDFGAGIFTGTNYWLDLGVRAVGVTNFTGLAPRQPVLPVPYAIFANSASNLLGTVSASQLTGTLPSAQVAGNYSGAVNFSNSTNSFNGAFTGNGGLLTNLSGAQITFGTVADARLTTNVALLNTNQTFSGTNNFTGSSFFTNATNFFNGAFAGNGPALTNLNGAQITFGTVADARLTTNVALLNRSQFYTGTNIFAGVNTLTNWGNTFVGNFSGNGLVQWVPVSQSTQAVRDTGYLLLNSGLTTVTLPQSANMQIGDIVRISGAGGGWLVAPNAGQSILGNFASYRNCAVSPLPLTGLASGSDCLDVASSADGTRMFAVGNFSGIYGSSDSGQTWSQIGIQAGSWSGVACSANGRIVYIAPTSGSTVLKSVNGGMNWSVTSSNGTSVACSADGSKFFTGTIAGSGNGTYLAEINNGISLSTNGGVGWFGLTNVPFGTPTCLAVSSDCTRLVAGVSGGLLYASANQGTTWTTLTTTNQYWSGAWMSADGGKFAATVAKGSYPAGAIFSAAVSAQPNTVSTNPICGSQGAAVELQFFNNNQFMPVSSAGLIWAN